MANVYEHNNSIQIDALKILDWTIKFNTVTYVKLEVTFNTDMAQVLNKYAVTIKLVDPLDDTTVYASFTPLYSHLSAKKKIIAINGAPTAYTLDLVYFNNRYADKNFFDSTSSGLVTITPKEKQPVKLLVTVGTKKYYGDTTRKFAEFSNSNMPVLPTSFTYLQQYDIKTSGYYLENTDVPVIMIKNQEAVLMTTFNSVNLATPTPVRLSEYDFVYAGSAGASFSGSNSYVTLSNWNISSTPTPPPIALFIKKGSLVNNLTSVSSSFINMTNVGSTKSFNFGLNNATYTTDVLSIEVPLFKDLSGINLSSVSIVSASGRVMIYSTSITPDSNGKWTITIVYKPTGDTNLVATYPNDALITLNFSNPTISLVSTISYAYTNS